MAAIWNFPIGILTMVTIMTGVYGRGVSPQDASTLSRTLQDLCTSELHHNRFSDMFNNATVRYLPAQIDGDLEVGKLANSTAAKIQLAANVVNGNALLMENLYHPLVAKTYPAGPDCCLNPAVLTAQNQSWNPVNHSTLCTSLFSRKAKNKLAAYVVSTFQSKLKNGITRLYAGDKNGTYYQYPAGGPQPCTGNTSRENDFRYKSWYVNSASPKKKNIVIVFDESKSMDSYATNTRTRMMEAKDAANTVLNTLSPKDWAGVVAFSNVARTPKGCYKDKIAQANSYNKEEFRNFVNNISTVNQTVYTEGLKTAFKMLLAAKRNQLDQFENSLDTIIFLTDGVPTDSAKSIRKVIAEGNQKMNNSVSIFFYGIGKMGTTQKVKIPTLIGFADQNNNILQYKDPIKNTVHKAAAWQNYPSSIGPPGHFHIIDDNQLDDLSDIMGSYYLNYPKPVFASLSFSIPFVDPLHGLTVTVATPLFENLTGNSPELFGVTAADVKFEALFEDISYYKQGLYSYAFLVTREGKVISHRNFARPSKTRRDIDFVTLDIAEQSLTKNEIEDITKHAKTGSIKAEVALPMSRGMSQKDGSYKLTLNATFHYQPVLGFEEQYSVVVVLFDEDKMAASRHPRNINKGIAQKNTAHYHRLDLKHGSASSPKANPPSSAKSVMCKNRQSYLQAQNSVTKNLMAHSTIKFAPHAYLNPNKYLTQVETTQDVKLLESILRGQQANTVLKRTALEDAQFTQSFESLVSTSTTNSVSKYLATVAGVFRISPGMQLDSRYDGTDEPWYRQSTLYQDRCVFTRPGYSPTGNQQLVTISRAVHTPQGTMVGAIAADIPYTAVGAIAHTIPACSSQQWKCVIMDHSGYIVTEPGTPSPKAHLQLKHQHLVEIAPYVAADIIGRHKVLKTKTCRQTQGLKKVQVFHDFDLTYPAMSSDPSIRPCMNYTLYPIKNTNLHFLAIDMSPSCPGPAGKGTLQSCSCSSKSSSCVSCNNNTTTCQCPCTCTADVDVCTNKYAKNRPPLTCPAPWIPSPPPKQNLKKNTVGNCPLLCYERGSKADCLADGSCKWCKHVSGSACLKYCPISSPIPPRSTVSRQGSPTPPFTSSCTDTNNTVRVVLSSVGTSSGGGSPQCPIKSEQFCHKYCTATTVCDDSSYNKLAAGLGVPLAVISALSGLGLLAFLLKRRPPLPIETPPTKVRPIDSFVPNIYRASMGDILTPTVGQKGAELDSWNSSGQAMYGRPSLSE